MVRDLNPKNLHINNGLIILQNPKQKSYIQGLFENYPTNGIFFQLYQFITLILEAH